MVNFHDFDEKSDKYYQRVANSYGEFCYFIHRFLDDLCQSQAPANLNGDDLLPFLLQLQTGEPPEKAVKEAADLIYERYTAWNEAFWNEEHTHD